MGAFGKQLGKDKPRFDGFAETNLVSQDAAAFGNPAKSEHHCVDLGGVRIDLAAPLRTHITTAFTCSAKAHEVFGVVTPVDGVWCTRIQR